MRYTTTIDENKEIETVTDIDCPTLAEMLEQDDLFITATPLPSKGVLQLRFSDRISAAAALNKAACCLPDILDNARSAYRLSAHNKRYRAAEDSNTPPKAKCTTAPDNRTVCTQPAQKQQKQTSKAETGATETDKKEAAENTQDKKVIHRDVDKIEEAGYIVDTSTGFAINADGEVYLGENGEPLQICTTATNAHRNYKSKEKSVFNCMLPALTLFITVNIAFMTNPDKIKDVMAKFYKAAREKFGNVFCNIIAYETTEYRDWHTHNLLGFWDEIPNSFIEWTTQYFAKNSTRGNKAVEIRILQTAEEIKDAWDYLDPTSYKKVGTLKYYPPNFRRFETSNGFKINPESRVKNKETTKKIIKEVTGADKAPPVNGIGNLIKYKDKTTQVIFKYDITIPESICQRFFEIYREEMKIVNKVDKLTEKDNGTYTTTFGSVEETVIATVFFPDLTSPPVKDKPADTKAADINLHRPTIDEWIVQNSPYMTEWRERKQLYGHF